MRVCAARRPALHSAASLRRFSPCLAQEYTAKQLAHMITTGVGTRVSKKERQAMLQLIEDLDKQRR